ncbi:MAG: hypothetical protein GY832_36300 [Chloroflexi bacterium]|nr:hypothetical protein [Chloroflexota bacterium]
MMKGKIFSIIGVVVFVILVGALAWWLMLQVPPNAARLWALLVTVSLPFIAWGAWWFGNVEARGKLAGFDTAIDRTFAGLSKAAGLNVTHTRAMRTNQVLPQQTVILPDVEIIQRRLPSGSDIVEL